jgi:hypothetical protein
MLCRITGHCCLKKSGKKHPVTRHQHSRRTHNRAPTLRQPRKNREIVESTSYETWEGGVYIKRSCVSLNKPYKFTHTHTHTHTYIYIYIYTYIYICALSSIAFRGLILHGFADSRSHQKKKNKFKKSLSFPEGSTSLCRSGAAGHEMQGV